MAVSDVIPQDGGQGNVKLHPYLITLVRWCASCVWGSALVLLQRLLAAPLPRTPQITAGKPPRAAKTRAAGSEHLHPEPLVQCAVLHAPEQHSLDVIFVHGLYGSLGNTWRQGEWRTKYKLDPTKVPLRNHSTEPCSCTQDKQEQTYDNTQEQTYDNTQEYTYDNTQEQTYDNTQEYTYDNTQEQTYDNTQEQTYDNTQEYTYDNTQEQMYDNTREYTYDNTQEMYAYETNINEPNVNENVTFKQIKGCFKKILPNENSLITEKFYNDTLLKVDVDNYETQAKFVTELFKNDCDTNCDVNTFKCNLDRNGFKCNFDDRDSSNCDSVNCKCSLTEVCRCKLTARRGASCEAGCGCGCDDCYSPCWPRDWIKEDFPGARVISINYTSDPYLWRPLWVKGTKRLRLHERAEQMMEQLLALGVGQRPIVWVGHSKGGLFIKQIYCEAYEAHLKMNKSVVQQQSVINNNYQDQSDREYNINNNVHSSVDNKFNKYNDNEAFHSRSKDQSNNLLNYFVKEHNSASYTTNGGTKLRSIDEMNEIRNNNNSGNSSFNEDDVNCTDLDINYNMGQDSDEMYGCTPHGNVLDNKRDRYHEHSDYIDISVKKDEQYRQVEDNDVPREKTGVLSSNNEEDRALLSARACLWSASSGFMFYSVPHRGSPLADIKTPLTSRSVELQEIAKDCPLVLALQARWLAAARRARPRVRSVVETRRTRMAVLWLRIVAEDSADAGVGVLHGVSVDHREICKPASRRCPLYTELTRLIRGCLRSCRCP